MIAAPIIEMSGVSFRYPGDEGMALRGVHLSIGKGDFIAIMGSNGSGKSTLCKSLNGLIPHYYAGDFEGSVSVGGTDPMTRSVAEMSRLVGYVYQDFENQLIRPTVFDELTFARMNFGFADYKVKAEEMLYRFGLEPIRNKYIWQLSGGQKHRVALAGALAMEPEIVIVDEPAAQLDPLSAVHIYDTLKTVNEQFGTTVIVIEHHTEFIADYCKHAVLMEQGSVAWKLETASALNEVETLLAHQIHPPQVTQAAWRIYPERKPYPIRLEEAKKWFAPDRSSDAAAAPGSAAAGDDAPPLIERAAVAEFRHVTHRYMTVEKGRNTVLSQIDLTFREGERVALVGGNGAGKSTLLRLITGLAKPSEGMIEVLGRDTRTVTPEALAESVAFIYQQPEEMFIADNIRSDIAYFLKARKTADYEAFVDRMIAQFRLQDIQDRDGRLLSGGQQRRASLAIGIAMRPQILLLDEPTASLDISSRKEITGMLERLDTYVKTVIVATHDMQLAADWANRIIVLQHGRVLADTDGQALFADPALMRAANLQPPQIALLSQAAALQPPALSVEAFCRRWPAGGKEANDYRQAVAATVAGAIEADAHEHRLRQ